MAARTTRQRLERAALAAFTERGFDAVTTAQIAVAAGVTQRTFFRHFPTKLDALFGDTAERTYRFVLELYRQPELDLIDALIAAIVALEPDEELAALDLQRAQVLRKTPSLVPAVRAYEADLERHFVEWIGQRTQRPVDDFDVTVLAAILVAARRAVVDRWRATGGTVSMVDLAPRALAQVNVLEPGARRP